MRIFPRLWRKQPALPPVTDSPPAPVPAERVRCGVPTKRASAAPCTLYVVPGTDRCRVHQRPAGPEAT